jgi:hypothetical protein
VAAKNNPPLQTLARRGAKVEKIERLAKTGS